MKRFVMKKKRGAEGRKRKLEDEEAKTSEEKSEFSKMSGKFPGNINFCQDCGTILQLPDGISPVVKCKRCPYEVSAEAFDGMVVYTEVIFNKVKPDKQIEKEDNALGPLVDRECAKCGHEGMTFTTRQTRSADEGQTVFYSCPACGANEQEFS